MFLARDNSASGYLCPRREHEQVADLHQFHDDLVWNLAAKIEVATAKGRGENHLIAVQSESAGVVQLCLDGTNPLGRVRVADDQTNLLTEFFQGGKEIGRAHV